MARIGRLRERRLLHRAAEQALASRPLEQLRGAPTDSAQHPDRGPTRRGDDAPPLADDIFGGLRVAPWMFSMRARPWYRTRPAAIAFAGAAAAVVILGVMLALRTPTNAIEKSTTIATTPSPRATPSTRATPPASAEPPMSSIPPSPPIAPPPSPASAQPIDREPATAGPGSLEEPPPAEPIEPEPAIADVGPREEPPPAELPAIADVGPPEEPPSAEPIDPNRDR